MSLGARSRPPASDAERASSVALDLYLRDAGDPHQRGLERMLGEVQEFHLGASVRNEGASENGKHRRFIHCVPSSSLRAGLATHAATRPGCAAARPPCPYPRRGAQRTPRNCGRRSNKRTGCQGPARLPRRGAGDHRYHASRRFLALRDTLTTGNVTGGEMDSGRRCIARGRSGLPEWRTTRQAHRCGFTVVSGRAHPRGVPPGRS